MGYAWLLAVIHLIFYTILSEYYNFMGNIINMWCKWLLISSETFNFTT